MSIKSACCSLLRLRECVARDCFKQQDRLQQTNIWRPKLLSELPFGTACQWAQDKLVLTGTSERVVVPHNLVGYCSYDGKPCI